MDFQLERRQEMQTHRLHRKPDAKRRREVGSPVRKEGVKMYSPKIREDLIPKIYHAARAKGIKMTTLVNGILERVLNGGDELGAKEIVSSGKESDFPKENGRDHEYS
jgi:hypothetical protein